MRVMLDNSITGHSQFADSVMGPMGVRWGERDKDKQVVGFMRKPVDPNESYQAEMNALFTVGKLIRECRIQALTYNELDYESWHRPIGEQNFDALAGVKIERCEPAIHRSKFQGGNFFDYIRKGGRKDHKKGLPDQITMISFVKMLLTADNTTVETLIQSGNPTKLTDFEIESFRDIEHFQRMCKVGQSPENYPDMFHLWTSQRNQIDVFLTLERKLPLIAKGIRYENRMRCKQTKVLRPLELLQALDVNDLVPVPLEMDRFYPLIDFLVPSGKHEDVIKNLFPNHDK